VKTILKALASLTILPLIAAGSCDSKGETPTPKTTPAVQDTRPTCPGVTFDKPVSRCFTIQTFVESRLGPYDVYLNITGVGVFPPHVPIAGGGWNHGVKYDTGGKHTVTVTLEYERPGSKDGFCSITDGSQFVKNELKSGQANGGAPYIAVCTLTTNQ
jgi:hypothetical protein